MTPLEPQSAAPKPERRFQYSLRSLFALTTGAAAFFALGRMLGFADAIVILVGIVITVGVMEWPRRVYLATGILLTVVAGTLLWANLRTTGWAERLNMGPPQELDPIAKRMFWRGWPIAPWMTCSAHGMILDPSATGVYGILVLDAVAFAIIHCVVRGSCEFFFRRRDPQIIEPLPDTPPDGTSSDSMV
ncbi:MAG: hypothetical protein ABSG53_23875 [Thermoguttaceae bacterium]|jgi:hypothetical protein